LATYFQFFLNNSKKQTKEIRLKKQHK